jgi:cytochrome P450
LNTILEAMRLLTPVPFQMRRAASQTTLPGTSLALAERDAVVLSDLVMNRRPDRFGPDPTAFRPGRWSGADAPSAADVFAFSVGPRSCPGRSFAYGVLGAALQAILARWSVVLAPGQRLTDRTAITLSPRRVFVRLSPREGGFRRVRLQGRACALSPAI